MITQKQLTLADIFEDCQEIFESDKPQFLTLLENHIDLERVHIKTASKIMARRITEE